VNLRLKNPSAKHILHELYDKNELRRVKGMFVLMLLTALAVSVRPTSFARSLDLSCGRKCPSENKERLSDPISEKTIYHHKPNHSLGNVRLSS
jgi:hypothetical protein